ncbi:MAG: hypothetical protein K1W30_17975 [Lachnospiraceae bacterium]
MKYKLAEDVIIQKFEGSKYVIDLNNEKTYNVNDDAYRILESVSDTFLDIDGICDALGNGEMSASEIDREYIQSFIEAIKGKEILIYQ